MDIEQTTNIDEIPFNKLQIGQDDLKDEPLEVMELLVPPPQGMEISDDTAENTNAEELTEVERKLQREEVKNEMLNRIYVGQLGNEEDSNTDMDNMDYTYFE